MSNLLSQASLVMIPSGYKEDVVYSAIPTNGSGDLSFTRASNGTRVNSAGLVEVVAWNLVQQSETFDNVAWIKQFATVTANSTTAPNGTLTADTFNVTATAYSSIYNNGALSLSLGIYTQGIYAKKGTKNYLYILDLTATSAKAWFNLDTGVVGTVASGYTATMESVGNGWYRCSLSQNTSITPSYFHFGASDSDNSFTPSSSGNIYIYGAQLNIGSTAKPYFPTTDRLNVPRLTYQNGGGGCPSLLLEKQSTNLLTYSEQFDNADWLKQNLNVTANATTSPDGTQNADKLIANTTNGRHLIYQAFNVSTTHTFTTYAKAGENSFLIMRLDTDSPEIKTWFNLSNGTIGTSEGGSPTITSVGNGWYRCSVQFVSSTSQTVYAVLYTATTDNQEVFAGNGTDGTFVWGAQLEASSYATSYIGPTTSSSATRVADACSKTGISSLIGGTSGTVFFDIKTNPVLSSEPNKQFCYYTNSVGQQAYMFLGSTNLISTNSNWGSLSWATPFVANTRYKVALVYAPNDFALYVNGVSVATASSGTPLNAQNLISIGSYTGSSEWNEFVFNQYTHFPSRLTNAELASLTTI